MRGLNEKVKKVEPILEFCSAGILQKGCKNMSVFWSLQKVICLFSEWKYFQSCRQPSGHCFWDCKAYNFWKINRSCREYEGFLAKHLESRSHACSKVQTWDGFNNALNPQAFWSSKNGLCVFVIVEILFESYRQTSVGCFSNIKVYPFQKFNR